MTSNTEIRLQADKLAVTTLAAKMNILYELQFITAFIRVGNPKSNRIRPLLLKCSDKATKFAFFRASRVYVEMLSTSNDILQIMNSKLTGIFIPL